MLNNNYELHYIDKVGMQDKYNMCLGNLEGTESKL